MGPRVDVGHPPALRQGDAVAVVSPSSAVPIDRLEAGLAVVASWGLRPVEGRHARAVHGHLAGTDEQRIADLNAAFGDPAVRAVWATRGGYGLTRILHRLDWPALATHPKVLVGFSDVTALLVAAWQRIGLRTVHGQFVARLHLLTDAARERLRRSIFGDPTVVDDQVAGVVVLASGSEPVGGDRVVLASGSEPVGGAATAGPVAGPLVGGNLAVLASLAGTADQLRADGCILLLEEVDEAPYRVDRLLTQLRGSGALDGVAGIAVATPVRCAAPGVRSATFDEVVRERLGDLGVPLLTDLPLGHVDDQFALVHGATTVLDTTHGTLRQHESLESPDAGL
jgi:muramoyltetrapeptide carboxypeptidase